MYRLAVLAAAVVTSLLVAVGSASAAKSLTVCASGCQYTSIQDAIDSASPGSKIWIGPGTYGGGLTIGKSVSLVGAAPGLTSISGGGPVVTINSGASVNIRAVTISDGSNHSQDSAGAGIRNAGTLVLKDSRVTGNSAYAGGGIANLGTLTLSNSTVSDSSGEVVGGGIYNAPDGTATLNQSTVSGNSDVSNFGGGIANVGTLTLNGSTVRDNGAFAGGGIANTGILTVNGSTIVDNNAVYNVEGGGIYSAGGTVTVNDSLLSGNSATFGGGIYNAAGALRLNGSTVSGNSAFVSGGGIYNLSTVKLNNSTVTDNSPDDCVGC